jgi:hypothetical protein
MVYIITIITSFGSLLSFHFVNNAFSQAVPLIPINTGDSVLDKNLHSFYSCVGKAIRSNQNVDGISSYFKHEPTRNEVIDCYNSNIQGTDKNTNSGTDKNTNSGTDKNTNKAFDQNIKKGKK